MTDKCIVHGCQNHKHQDTFEGDLCAPCHRMLTTGEPKHGTTFVHDMEARILADADRIEELEALVEALTVEVEKADKMERALRWIGYKSPIIDASPATIQRHARAALAEALKGEE